MTIIKYNLKWKQNIRIYKKLKMLVVTSPQLLWCFFISEALYTFELWHTTPETEILNNIKYLFKQDGDNYYISRNILNLVNRNLILMRS